MAKALGELHRLQIVHVDLNPMNILYRVEKDYPVVRLVDFESSYARARHAAGVFYSPPTTPRFSAPEVSSQAPDARADVYSWAPCSTRCLPAISGRGTPRPMRASRATSTSIVELKEILGTAVAQDPARRYTSAGRVP